MKHDMHSLWRDVIDAHVSGQELLPTVIRWDKYIDEAEGVRPQNTLQHSYSLSILGGVLYERIRRHIGQFDVALFFTALLVHDHGEGEIQHDTLYADKNHATDLREYEKFAKRFRKLGNEFSFFNRAFLLQFARDDTPPPNFPKKAKGIMRELREHNPHEALAFDAAERWDYVIYALEQYQRKNNELILVQTLRNQIPHLNHLADALPGFGETIWTPEVQKTTHEFLKPYDGKMVEN